MAYQTIILDEYDSESPVTEGLLAKIVGNLEDLNTRSPYRTGDLIVGFDGAARTGFVLANDGTIGNAASGASARANADTEELFELIWGLLDDTEAPVSGGRGVSAQVDFDANKTIQLGTIAGRVIGAAGSGSGLTARSVGDVTGAQSVALGVSNLASHDHSVPAVTDAGSGAPGFIYSTDNTDRSDVDTANTGSGSAHNNMQPTTFFNVFIKL